VTQAFSSNSLGCRRILSLTVAKRPILLLHLNQANEYIFFAKLHSLVQTVGQCPIELLLKFSGSTGVQRDLKKDAVVRTVNAEIFSVKKLARLRVLSDDLKSVMFRRSLVNGLHSLNVSLLIFLQRAIYTQIHHGGRLVSVAHFWCQISVPGNLTPFAFLIFNQLLKISFKSITTISSLFLRPKLSCHHIVQSQVFPRFEVALKYTCGGHHFSPGFIFGDVIAVNAPAAKRPSGIVQSTGNNPSPEYLSSRTSCRIYARSPICGRTPPALSSGI
jgi:hypothetical protein